MLKFLTILLLTTQIALATQSPWHQDPDYDLKTRIISTHNSIPHNNNIQTAIEFKLNNWKIYGQNPTDTGLPTQFTIHPTANLKSYNVIYPKTETLTLLDSQSQGYQKHIAFPINIKTENPQSPITINATANFLACDKICIPITQKFTLTLEPTSPQQTAQIDNTANQIYQKFNSTLPALPALASSPSAPQNNIWVIIIVFSIIGGLILNIMPCVLPALALKAFALTKHDNKISIRKSCLATAMGIITCFMIIGISLIAIKFFGAEIGWGMQYQQPAFLSLLFMIMILFSANLFGWIPAFIFPLPKSLSEFIKPSGTPSPSSFKQDFMLGVLATILATPCSAPFLSTAVAAAMIVGGFEALLIFLGLGLGMALPYLAIALCPQMANFLPKPGRWMVFVKWILGALLLLTAVWLLWLLSLTLSMTITILIGLMGTLAVGYLYLRQAGVLIFKSPTALVPSFLILGALLLSFSPMDYSEKYTDTPADTSVGTPEKWVNFNEAKIASAVEAGKIVFVDVTADWCVTCQFNKFRVLKQGKVAQRLFSEDEDIILMLADWTHPNDSITNYLRQYGRVGVPMNVVYGPNARQGILLPEILSAEAVLSALEKAGG